MNAVEIEEAVSRLAEAPFDPVEFPYAFLEAFGNKETTLRRLRSGDSNQSDLPGGVLQRNNIHLCVCAAGEVTATLTALRHSPATARQKAKFILATDGQTLEAENLADAAVPPVVCAYADFPEHFGFFLPLAGISTVRQISENGFDIKATGRLNRLYLELLKDNPDWSTAARREDLNHFMARLIFCFFAEDTGIFNGRNLFTDTIAQMSARDSSDTHLVISEIFRAMNTPTKHEGLLDGRYREAAKIRSWANQFPYVNGGLFSDSVDVPRFSKIARAYLLNVGTLDWTRINPDIFGSMIQAVADDEERGALGMHYTSVPNILKVLNPLFLDELREKLAEAGDGQTPGSARKLLNLRQRLARIRVFDPACGSGNFLVIAYKELRAIEAVINERRGEIERHSDIPKENFRGIELRSFPCEIARLALIIAEYQCDVVYRGQRLALAEFLPLQKANWIICGNALRTDWLSVCPPTGRAVKVRADDLFEAPLDQAEIEFKNEGGETYICGNPPYKGATEQSPAQKSDMRLVFDSRFQTWKSFDYILGFFQKARDFTDSCDASFAFVTTNSVCQGEQVFRFWPRSISDGVRIYFAVTSFKWANLASHNAGVSVAIVGLAKEPRRVRLFDGLSGHVKLVANINAYLVAFSDVYVRNEMVPANGLAPVINGNKPADGGGLVFGAETATKLRSAAPQYAKVIRPFFGAHDATHGTGRFCLWASSDDYTRLKELPEFAERFSIVRDMRLKSDKALTKEGATKPFEFQQIRQSGDETVFQIPRHSSEAREYYPIIALPKGAIVGDGAFSFYDPPLWNVAIFASRLSLVWIGAVCGKIKTDFRFSNTLGWNTFPVPPLTEQNKADLTRRAEDILLAREAHFPATIADLYDPEAMPPDLRAAHDRNDETLERIYIGRRFKNDTERLEKLFALYTEMSARSAAAPAKPASRRKKAAEA